MKKITFILCSFLFVFGSLFSNTLPNPEKIHSITRVSKSFDYYLAQAELWRKETQKSRSDAAAWFNYFQAARYANMLSGGTNPVNLQALVNELPDAIPHSAELHYINYVYAGRGADHFPTLLKAYELAPEHPEILHDMLTYYEVQGNREKVRHFSEQWYQSGEMSSAILAWNYNLLMSVESDGVLLTWGDNDTYPLWMLQMVKEVQPNVKVLNASLLCGFDSYRNTLFEKADIAPFEATQSDYTDYKTWFSTIVNHVLKHSKRPVYLSPSIPKILNNKYDDQLYWVGIAFKYSPESFDNLATLKNNFENQFLTDYLKINLSNDISEDVVNHMNLNYLPPFLRLFQHYNESGETTKANQMKTLLITIAEKGGRLNEIRPYLGESNPTDKYIESILDIRTLDDGFVKIKQNLYASTTELTNDRYEQFLMDLLKNREFDKLEIAKTQKTNWRGLLSAKFDKYIDSKIFEHGHPDDLKTPIQNISHEAAKLYCEWVTTVYNQSNHKKKRFQRVVFRLPSESEWVLTAKGGVDAIYPWGGYEATNAVGCYLANFNVSDLAPCTDCKNPTPSNDGGFFPVKADSYFPNNYGCYNMSGNVAEMIQEAGIAMGGSWNDRPEDCKVDSKAPFDTPSPTVGFRVFLEVLEYKP